MLNRDITMEDMVKIIQHISNKRTLTEEEIKEYDCNDNGIVNMDDFIMSFEMLMKGPYEHRSWKNYNIFKKVMREENIITKNSNYAEKLKSIVKQNKNREEYLQTQRKRKLTNHIPK